VFLLHFTKPITQQQIEIIECANIFLNISIQLIIIDRYTGAAVDDLPRDRGWDCGCVTVGPFVVFAGRSQG
jgi:hypothetical protein